jgi:hypothetical protein
MSSRVRGGVAILGVLVAVLAGCAQAKDLTASSDGARPVLGGPDPLAPYGVPCDGTPDVPAATPLPADAMLVRATRCLFELQTIAGDGQWRVRLDQEATTGLDALAAALRLPSQETPPGTACDAVGYVPFVISVSDSGGRQLQPAVPHGICGAPLQAVTDAFMALTWTTVDTTPIQQVTSELSLTSGCPDAWKPVIAIVAVDDARHQPTSTVDVTPVRMRVCRYAPDAAQTVDMGNGAFLHVGGLSGSSTMDPSAAHELLAAVGQAPRANSCAQVESPFAVVSPVDGGGPSLTVELGGCSRVLVDADTSLRQLDATLVTRLLG